MSARCLAAANEYGEALLKNSTPADWVYGNMPVSHDLKTLQASRAGMVGMAYLELYQATHDKKWFDAAWRIAETLKKTQLPEGRWPFRVDPQTGQIQQDPQQSPHGTLGEPLDYTSDQAEAILLLDELIRNHGGSEFQRTCDKAVAWMLANPCKTYLWQQQWDDLGVFAPYENLEWYDTALFIEYLLRYATPDNGYEQTARELMRYIEDNFVEWESTGERAPNRGEGDDFTLITPGCREQYVCYDMIDWHCAHYIRICVDFHARTHEGIWLRKARAMADTLTAIQHPDGFYPTWMQHRPSTGNPEELKGINFKHAWPNCASYVGEQLLRLDDYQSTAGSTRL